MKPDFAQLEKFEEKVERLVERLEDREHGLEVEEVINVMGSTAGAGSGCADTKDRNTVHTKLPTLANSGTHASPIRGTTQL